ncbi:MAG: helix-hairpin-helix domain-containing protein [Candidatus Diapherotrites archaeon]|nr:helix-hairpin-helix domain-containing protein [Candidatus Diapherotrites archaeon]
MSDKQSTLTKYVVCEKPVIFCDDRETSCKVVLYLKKMGADIKSIRLDIGDYLISEKIVVERKTSADFLSSLCDGRLFEQVKNITSYEKPILIIEGSPESLFAIRDINKKAILGALIAISIDFGISILFSRDEAQTAEILYLIAKRNQLGPNKEIVLNKKRKMGLLEQQQFIVESLPLIGPKTAKELLKRFGSVRGVFSANEKELEDVSNIGPKKAKRIIEVLDAKYN